MGKESIVENNHKKNEMLSPKKEVRTESFKMKQRVGKKKS